MMFSNVYDAIKSVLWQKLEEGGIHRSSEVLCLKSGKQWCFGHF